MLTIPSSNGLFQDGWTGRTASLFIASEKPLQLFLFLPKVQGIAATKTVHLYYNGSSQSLDLKRGELTPTGSLEPADGGLSLQLVCEDVEPPSDDYRELGVFIARLGQAGADSVEVREILRASNEAAKSKQPSAAPATAPATAPSEAARAQAPATAKSKTHPAAGASTAATPVSDFELNAVASLFDVDFYLSGFSKEAAPSDPIRHFLTIGCGEGRNPTPWFSNWHYLSMHPDVAMSGMNPFLHYCIAGHKEGRALPQLGKQAGGDIYAAHAFAVAPGPDFEEFDPNIGRGRTRRAKVLAYYLPQFHAVDVNDQQWGKGFTEWRNLPRAMPRYQGHIQPRIPRDLGCYSLSEGDAIRRQIEMAKAGGIHGFCFYHYWFDGQRVLETPMERFLTDSTLDMPFCLMWANENWTRTWDGSEKDVILQHSYRPEDDVAFIDDVARHMLDARYIRLSGRPIFFIYRPTQIPEPRVTISRWRELMRERHNLEPLFLMAQAFGDLDPRVHGMDGAIEFPPHKICQGFKSIAHELDLIDRGYSGHIVSYDDAIERSRSETSSPFPLIRTVTPTWDNEARRPGRGMILHGSTPAKFEAWVDDMVAFAEANPVHGEKLIAVNAWNEWAEGAVLEPDVHYGGAYLNALSRSVHGRTRSSGERKVQVLIVGHDAQRNGAQMLALNIGRTLSSRFGIEVRYLLGGDGPLVSDYRAIGPVEIIPASQGDATQFLKGIADKCGRIAVTNTTPSGRMLPALKAAGFTVVSLIHELPNLLRSYGLEKAAADIAALSDHVIFPAQVVQEKFEAIAGPIKGRAEVYPQGLYNTPILAQPRGDHGLREELGLDADTRIVLGVGYADLRKGIDRFVSTGLSLCAQRPKLAFVWVGAPAGEAIHWFLPEVAAAGLASRIRVLGHRDDIARFFAASDVFYLSSREDPFPSVVLEAIAAGLPVVGHKGSGGCDALIRKHGSLVPQNDPMSVTEAILRWIKNPISKTDAAGRRAEIVQNYDFNQYVFGLVQRLKPALASVSAVVPNYKYEAYIGERLRTVFDQTYPLQEVIVLDDASPDGSVAEIQRTAEAAHRVIDLHVNQKNSGSPFPQWRKGVELAKGDYVWIAEADDLAEPSFVARLMDQMQQAGSVLGFVDSRQVDGSGHRLGDSYRPYINQIEAGAFDVAFDMDGPEFLARFLAVKNVILNVSGVILRRQTLLEAFHAVGPDLYTYHVAGDWRLYAEICSRPGNRVTYIPSPLNTHRRHTISVTHALNTKKHLSEIASLQHLASTKVSISKATMKLQAQHLEASKTHLSKLG